MKTTAQISADMEALLRENNDRLLLWYKPGRPFTLASLFVMGGLQRIASNTHGFDAMVKARNYPIVGSILRMQLDTAMRLYGLRLMPDVNAAVMSLMSGGQYNKIKGKDGKPLRDAVLIEALSREHAWVSEVYQRTSGMTHLSGTHIHHALDHSNSVKTDAGLSINFVISPTGPDLPDSLFQEAGEAFLHATMIASAEALAFLASDAAFLEGQETH